ncbi:SDR family oxidoreductase, partial [uncultured Pseudoalteromonas sp.]|uniref:SDR family oxidoreductase n=1 Tax=uncultured Pseudoalteromonas sp. TaxID=114053 RepID=UPI0025966081
QIMQDPEQVKLSMRADDTNSSAVVGFNTLLEYLSDVIKQVQTQSDSLKNNSQELINVHDELADSAKHRNIQTDDIANACVFLLSGLSAMITGTSIKIDGGWTAQ